MRKIIAYAILPITFIMANNSTAIAQDSTDKAATETQLAPPVITLKQGESHFMMVGLTTIGFVAQTTTNTLGGIKNRNVTNSLADADRYEFSPMFLWRHGNNMLIEFEPSFDGTNLNVNWADVSYVVAPGFMIKAGYLVLPFGTYTKRLAAGWINKLASDPVGTDMAGSDFGVEFAGGFPLGNMKWSYDVSLSNGLQLNNDGSTQGVGPNALNTGKTVCGRLALLPFSNSSLEIGVSALAGALATPPGATFMNTNPTSTKGPSVNMFALDLNYIKNINPVQINAKAQYSASMVNDMNYMNPNDSTQTYTFSNKTSTAFGQVSFRPTLAKNNVIKNLELAFRYVNYTSPKNSTWGQNYNEMDVALDYWLSWRTVLKLAYESVNIDGTSSVPVMGIQGSTNISRMIIQFSTEF
ncbi:MAG: hypothetical protein WCG87_08490 [Bacteroidota bacterium]